MTIKEARKPFKIYNPAVKYYADCCKSFSHDTASWGRLDEFSFYTTGGFAIDDWIETFDNNVGGIDLSWAFHLSDEEIEQRAAEKLFEKFEVEVQLAIDDEWSLDGFQHIIDRFNFK